VAIAGGIICIVLAFIMLLLTYGGCMMADRALVLGDWLPGVAIGGALVVGGVGLLLWRCLA
jgi:hypothetical protein